MKPSDIVDQFWRRIQARDWDAVGELLADEFVLEWPNARVCIRGRTNFVEFNRSYPEGWSIEVLRIVAEGNTALTGSSRCDDPAAETGCRRFPCMRQIDHNERGVRQSSGVTRGRPLGLDESCSRRDGAGSVSDA